VGGTWGGCGVVGGDWEGDLRRPDEGKGWPAGMFRAW
jgi:hypothetical protein